VVYGLGHGRRRRLVDAAFQVADHLLGRLPPHD
jgi:hypothetical protein